MHGAGNGRFIAIGSNRVQDPVVPYHDYTTGKAALLGFVRNMASEVGEKTITVNMVSGGLLDPTDASLATPDAVFDLIAQNTPRGRVTTPDDVADAVLMMASPRARAVTGQNLIVDGGLVMRCPSEIAGSPQSRRIVPARPWGGSRRGGSLPARRATSFVPAARPDRRSCGHRPSR